MNYASVPASQRRQEPDGPYGFDRISNALPLRVFDIWIADVETSHLWI